VNWIEKAGFISLLFLFLFPPWIFPSADYNPRETSTLKEQYLQAFAQGIFFQSEGNFSQAADNFNSALSIAFKLKDREKQCHTLIKAGLMQWNMGNLEEAEAKYKKSLNLAEILNSVPLQKKCSAVLKIQSLYSQGRGFRSSGEYNKAINSFQQAIDLACSIHSKEHELKCLRHLSLTYDSQYNLENLHLNAKKALDIARKLHHKREIGLNSINLGIFFEKTENYSKALSHYEEALLIARELKNKNNQAACLNNISIIYKELGNHDKAIDCLQQALEIDKESGNEIYIAMDLNNLAETYRKKGLFTGKKEDLNRALNTFKKALELIKKKKNKKTELQILNNIGTVNSDLKKYNEALKYFKSGLDLAEEIKDKESLGMILNNLGIVYYNLGNYPSSTKAFQKAVNLAQTTGGDNILWEAYLEYARLLTTQKKYSEALKKYKQSISIIENIRSEIDLEEQKASFMDDNKRIEAYHGLINLLISLHKDHPEKAYNQQAFNYLERARARAFLDQLRISGIDISQNINFKLLNRKKEIEKDMSEIIAKLYASDLSDEGSKNLHKQLTDKENDYETLKRAIRSGSPVYANLNFPEIITLKETQTRLLDSNTLFIEYLLGEKNSWAFAVTKNDLKIFPLPPLKRLRTIVTDYIKTLSDKENHDFHQGHILYKTLVSPALTKGIKNIVFFPDNILLYLPFETLITHNSQTNWLVNDYDIAYSSSISSLQEIILRKKSNGEKRYMDLLAFGDPYFGPKEKGNSSLNYSRLKYSSTEIRKISQHFKKSKVFLQNEASEETLKNLSLEDYKIIHFATHSRIDNNSPARSHITLARNKDTAENDFLETREIYNLKLNADLVTLSACESGLGKLIKGEGIEGLNRAFFYAGASSLLISLWPVNDQATSQLMERFYIYLKSSESISSALRKTKLEMINSYNLSHPYYWAGFIISGKADHVIFSKGYKQLFYISAAFLLLFLMISLARKNRFLFQKH